MKSEKVVFTEETAIIPRDLYFDAWVNVCGISQFLEDVEGVGDDMFQAEIYKAACYLLCRSFPVFSHDEEQ